MDIRGFRIKELSDSNSKIQKIIVYDVSDLSPGGIDLKATFESGQCFRWKKIDDLRYFGIVRDKAVNVSVLDKRNLLIENSTSQDFDNIWFDYFDLGTDYSPIVAEVSRDDFMKAAAIYSSGARMLCQDFEETLFSYILSSQNNIPRIIGLVDSLCKLYGNLIVPREGTSSDISGGYTFPSASVLAEKFCNESPEICAICSDGSLCINRFGGYRCRYIAGTAEMLANGKFLPDFERLASQDVDLSRKELCILPGVGEKVADCVLLYSGIRKDICPIDTWVEKTIKKIYLDESASKKSIREFTQSYFGNYAGYAQLWFFNYARNTKSALE